MKFFWSAATAVLGASLGFAQQSSKPQVLFSGPPQQTPQLPAPTSGPASPISDALRRSIVITAWDLDIHLAPRDQSLEAHARVTLHNTGSVPLTQIPLQLSSTLTFETIGLDGRRLPFTHFTLLSDTDHTGALHEILITLPTPLAPQAELTLTVDYGGTVPLTAARLTAIGAPGATAEASDWDRISPAFTGLRGFGNVVWYPVCSLPVFLANGDSVSAEIGRQKLLDQEATVALRVTDEFFSSPPNAAILDGHFVPLNPPAAMPTAAFPGVITFALPATRLGFEVPSLFLARRTAVSGNGLRILALDTDTTDTQPYLSAAGLMQPLLRTWFGARAHPPATVLDLPDPDDAAAETGDLLAMPLATDAAHPGSLVAQALAHAAFSSPRAWLNEGVAAFFNTLWIESTIGRTAALESLNAGRTALALAEPASPGDSSGKDLLHAASVVRYRTKSAYVFWMLRNLIGDRPLQIALQAYNPAQDATPAYFENLLAQASGQDLGWFFQDWVDRDPGLPDLSIAGVYSSPEAHQQVLVAIDIVNTGYAAATVPVTVKGADTSLTTEVRVPAHTRITHRVIFQEMPTEVDVNDGSVPEVQDSIHRKILTVQ